MKDKWYFCVTPDWPGQTGLFLPNTPGLLDFQFWYNPVTGDVLAPDNPPELKQSQSANKDQVGFAIEVTQTAGVNDYTVDDIAVVSTIRQTPSAGATPALLASPFRKGNNAIACHFTGAPVIRIMQGPAGQRYKTTRLHEVSDDGSGPGSVSAYEISLVASLSDLQLNACEFSTDPEMDVDNGP